MDPAELARPARLASVGKITVSAGYLLALFTVAETYPMLYGGFIFVPAAGLTVVRHLRVLMLRPSLRASETHLQVKIWSARFLVPWVFEEERAVPWSALTGATVHTLSVNGLETSSLMLKFDGGAIEIEPGVFAESAGTLQRRILDRHARRPALAEPRSPLAGARERVVAPIVTQGGDAKASAGVQERFATPIVVRSGYTLVPASIALALAGVVAVVGALTAVPWFLWLSVAVLPLLFSLGMYNRYASERKVRCIELRADGLAVGPSPTQLVCTPWQEIVYAQLVTSNDVPYAVRVVMGDGRELLLHGKYSRGFEELRALIESRHR